MQPVQWQKQSVKILIINTVNSIMKIIEWCISKRQIVSKSIFIFIRVLLGKTDYNQLTCGVSPPCIKWAVMTCQKWHKTHFVSIVEMLNCASLHTWFSFICHPVLYSVKMIKLQQNSALLNHFLKKFIFLHCVLLMLLIYKYMKNMFLSLKAF